MLCLEVWVNGERQCIAGLNDFARLSASLHMVDWSKEHLKAVLADCAEGEDDISEIFTPELRVYGGIDSEPNQHMTWLERAMGLGDEITFKIVEAEKADEPEIYVSEE